MGDYDRTFMIKVEKWKKIIKVKKTNEKYKSENDNKMLQNKTEPNILKSDKGGDIGLHPAAAV